MRALMKVDRRPECLVQEVEIPKPRHDEALIKVLAARALRYGYRHSQQHVYGKAWRG